MRRTSQRIIICERQKGEITLGRYRIGKTGNVFFTTNITDTKTQKEYLTQADFVELLNNQDRMIEQLKGQVHYWKEKFLATDLRLENYVKKEMRKKYE